MAKYSIITPERVIYSIQYTLEKEVNVWQQSICSKNSIYCTVEKYSLYITIMELLKEKPISRHLGYNIGYIKDFEDSLESIY